MRFKGILGSITRVRGVRGAMIAGREDGLVIADNLMEGVRGNAVAALAASLYARLGAATGASGIGAPQFMHLQGDGGALLVLAAGSDVLIVVVTEPAANAGLVRLEMLRAAEAVA